MDIYDIEIYRSKVGVKYFELMDTIKGLSLPQKNTLVNVLKRMGVEYKVISHQSPPDGIYDMFGGFKPKLDDDDFFDNFIKGVD